MKKLIFISLWTVFLLAVSCKNDDAVSCITCSSEITQAFELCKEADGNASVNGEDTGTDYNQYYQGLMDEGVVCN